MSNLNRVTSARVQVDQLLILGDKLILPVKKGILRNGYYKTLLLAFMTLPSYMEIMGVETLAHTSPWNIYR